MVVDSSALIAILREEPEARTFTEAIVSAEPRAMISAPTLLETSIVLERAAGAAAIADLDALIELTQIDVVPFGAEHLEIAREAYRRYGKGTGHPANLNVGDCFAYALAKTQELPLLFKGVDFTETDVLSAGAL